MLPATGLFRAINCPFFEKDLCTRPFCHFRHSKPEVPAAAAAAATYSATPKSLLNQNNGPVVGSADGPARKKPKLEYIPMPTILAPKYVPSTKPVAASKEAEPEKPAPENKPVVVAEVTENKQINGHAEKNKTVVVAPEPVKESEKLVESPPKVVEEVKSKEPKLDSAANAVERNDSKKEPVKKEKTSSSRSSSSSKNRTSSKDEPESRKDKPSLKETDRKGSSSSSSDRKHSSSSRKEDKSRSSSDKDKNREKDRSSSKSKESSKDKEQKTSSSREKDQNVDKPKSSSSNSSEKDKSRSSSKSDKEKSSGSSSKPSEKDRHRSSHSSSSSKSKSSSSSSKPSSTKSSSSKSKTSSTSATPSKPKMELAEEIYRELLDNPPSDIDVDSDEDEVMKQCKMIFEEYDTEPPAPAAANPAPTVKKKPSTKKPSSNSDVELIDIFADKYYDENRKKRVAHENVTNSKPAAVVPAPVKKTNHVQNAMRSVYLRQEVIRKQQEEVAAKQRVEEEAKKRIEDETRKAMSKPVTPRLSNGSPRSPILSPTVISTPPSTDKSPVSPITTSSFYSKTTDTLTTPRSRFAPASNVLAFQKAKEKIDHLRKMKGMPTVAQTAPKGTGRMAHVSTSAVAAAAAAPQKPAPPMLEADATKISYNIRSQYYNLMIKHCLTIYPSCEDAWDRAQTEELAVFKKCSTPMIYKSSALLSINKLRKEAVETGSEATDKNKTISHDVILAGKMGHNISWSVNKKLKSEAKSTYTIDNAPSTVAYKMIYDCILTEEQLQSNNFPRPTDVPGKAKIHTPKPRRPPNEEERYCSRCSKVFNLETYEEPAVDSCNYHAKSTCYRRGFADNLHSCCQQPSGTPGCMYGNYHVSSFIDYDNLTGFVKTIDPPEGYVCSKKDVFALDCEMCYTTGGLELTRVTVVDINEKTVYDTLVKPPNMVVDYNTRFSGITEQMLKETTTTLYNVQAVLLSMFNSETILIGHSLDSDFKALKLIHDVVVDTSVLYPHKMGPPKKRALKTLCIENLKKIIQENDAGHDSAEDSVVCIQLIKHYLRNRIL